MSIKIERIADSLVKEISTVIQTEVKDDNIKMVTITHVKLASDLSYAKVYFTTFLDDKREVTTKALNRASNFIRMELYDLIDIRKMPELEFVYDDSIEYGANIERIIDQINE